MAGRRRLRSPSCSAAATTTTSASWSISSRSCSASPGNTAATRRSCSSTFWSVCKENPPEGLYAIVAMRSEFLGVCARFKGLAEAVNQTQYLLPQMERPALLRAIREPATLYDGEVSRELAERLIADAGGGQDQLPLIQHGLMVLWRRKTATRQMDSNRGTQMPYAFAEAAAPFRYETGPSWRLGLEDYRAAGGLAELLSKHADDVMAKAAPDPRRAEDRRASVPGADRHQRRGQRRPPPPDPGRAHGGDGQRRADPARHHRSVPRRGRLVPDPLWRCADRAGHPDRHQPRGPDPLLAQDRGREGGLAAARVPGSPDLAVSADTGGQVRREQKGDPVAGRDRVPRWLAERAAEQVLDRALRRRLGRGAGTHGGKP